MKTKVVQHVPRINISISHKRCDMGKVKSDMWLLSDIPIFLNLGWGGGGVEDGQRSLKVWMI